MYKCYRVSRSLPLGATASNDTIILMKLIQIMVYINKNSDEFVIIPKHLPSISRVYDLRLVNNLSKVESIFPSIISTSKNSLLYCFKLNINDFEDGEYTFSATFSGEPCENTVTIKSQNRTNYEVFKKNVCLYRFTATWCVNCPSMTEGLDRVNDWTKGRLVELDMHGAGSTYQLSDGTRFVADHLISQFKAGGFPSCVYDLDLMSDSRSYSEIEELVFDRIAEAPATCGIKANSTFAKDELTLQASVKTSTGGTYDLGYALLVNNLDGGAGAYEDKYNNVVIALSGNYENLSTAAQELAKDQEKQIVDFKQTVTLPDGAKPEDCSLVVFALKQNGSDIDIDNAVRFPLGGSVEYIYN